MVPALLQLEPLAPCGVENGVFMTTAACGKRGTRIITIPSVRRFPRDSGGTLQVVVSRFDSGP